MRLFAILLIPKGFIFETSCFLCQLDFGLFINQEKNYNERKQNSDNFVEKESFLAWTKKNRETVFSIQKCFFQSQSAKKKIFFANMKEKKNIFFAYSKNPTSRIRQFAALPFFKAITYQSFNQFQKKIPKTTLFEMFSPKIEQFLLTSLFTPFTGEILSKNSFSKQFLSLLYDKKRNPTKTSTIESFLMLTEAEQLSLLVRTKSSKIKVGELVLNGQKITQADGFKEGGQIIEIDGEKIVLRRGQNFVNYSQSSLFITPEETISQGWPIMTFSYQRSKTEDIVQGIPKIDQFFESRSLTEKHFLSLEIEKIDEENKKKYPNEQAVLKSYERIQLMILESIQRIYLAQGVAISDKHIEIVVKQMTSAVFMYDENGNAGQYFPFLSNFSHLVREAKSLGPVIERTRARNLFMKRVMKNYSSIECQQTLNETKRSQNTIIEINTSLSHEKKDFVQIKNEVILAGLKISLFHSTSHIQFLFSTIVPFFYKKKLSFQFPAKSQSYFVPFLNKTLLKEYFQNLLYFKKLRFYSKTTSYKNVLKVHSSFLLNETKNNKVVFKNVPIFPIYGTIKTKVIAKSNLAFFYANKTLLYANKTLFKTRLNSILAKSKSNENELFSPKKIFFKRSSLTIKKPKWVYLPVLIGITQAALTSTSFLSAASFQQTTLVLSRSSSIGRIDFLRGIKERVIFGECLFAGTGHPFSSLLTFSLSREIKFFFSKFKKRKSNQLKKLTRNKNFFITHQNTLGLTTQKKQTQGPKFLLNCCNFRKLKLKPTVQNSFRKSKKNEFYSSKRRKLETIQIQKHLKNQRKISQMFLKKISSQKLFDTRVDKWLKNFKGLFTKSFKNSLKINNSLKTGN